MGISPTWSATCNAKRKNTLEVPYKSISFRQWDGRGQSKSLSIWADKLPWFGDKVDKVNAAAERESFQAVRKSGEHNMQTVVLFIAL